MQMDRYHLSKTEWLCFLPACPVPPSCATVSTVHINPNVLNLPYIDALLIHSNNSFPAKSSLTLGPLVTSSPRTSSSKFIFPGTGMRLDIKLSPSRESRWARACGTPEVSFRIGCLHVDRISFLVLEESTVVIILGRPWFTQHQPIICWTTGEILKWIEYCVKECLINLHKIPCAVSRAMVSSTSVEIPDSQKTEEILAEYWAYQNVFSKSAVTRLPPHRPWDCAFDLLPGAKLPKGQIYPLLILERAAMEEYI